jgi:iron complex outermembrane recepter protein
VPIAITAFNENEIARLQITDLSRLGRTTPNVILDPAPGYRSSTAFSIRGLSFQDPDPTFEPAVGIVLDGVFLATANANLLDIYDIEQIEVLRGPQGTLFGKNTIGGLINVRSKRPSGDFHASAQVDAGNYGRLNASASIEGALVEDVLAVKLAGLTKHMDGYFHNLLDGETIGKEDSSLARLTVAYTPSDTFDMTLVGDVTRNQDDASPQRAASPPGYAAAAIGYPASTDPDLFDVNVNGDNRVNLRTEGLMLESNWKLASHVVTSITGYRNTDDTTSTNLAGTPVTIFQYPRTRQLQQLSEELRVASTWSDTLDYVAGIMYFRKWHSQDQSQIADCRLIGACSGIAPGLVSVPLNARARQEGHAYAVFAQGNYRLTPRTRLTLGGRYSWEDKTFSLRPPGYNLAPPALAPYVRDKATFSDFTPRAGVDFTVTDDLMLYASFASGFKAGGFNGRANRIGSIGPYQPEQVDAYEVGLKSEWLNRRLRANVAAFYSEYDDMQVDVIVPSTAGSGQETLVRNAGTASTRGVELELTALPAAGLSLSASVGYLDASYESFFADVSGTGVPSDNTHLKLRRAPEWTTTAAASYEMPLGQHGTLTYAADVNYTSEYETNVLNDAFARRPGATLLDANVAFTTADGRYGVALYGRNLTDRRFINNGIAAGRLFAFNEPNRPRTYGIQFSMKY